MDEADKSIQKINETLRAAREKKQQEREAERIRAEKNEWDKKNKKK